MPAALDIDREAVRVLVVAIGPRAAARELGLPEDTVLAWSARYGWVQKAKEQRVIAASRVREREESRGIVQSVAIKTPAEALSDVLADHEKETKLSLARTARANAMEAELAGLDAADKALATGKLAALSTMKTLLCFTPDGEFVREGEFESTEAAWEHSSDMGSRWYFYPIHLTTTGRKSASRIADVPCGFPREWIGKTVKTISAVLASDPEHSCDYANGKCPFCIYP